MDYTISKGDTLGAIAKKFNTDVNTLAKANNIANPNLIQAGAKLAIPSISAEKISTTPISIPPVPPPTKDPNAFVTSLQSQIQPLQQASDTASTNVNTAQQDLITLQKQLEGKTAEQIKLENEQNIPQINTELVGLQSEAQRLTTEYLNAIRNREAQGGVAAVVSADQKRIQSQAASDIGLINAQIQAKQGQLELARGTVDRAIAIKYEPLIQSLETKKLIYEMNKDSLSRADQKLLEAKNKEWTIQQKEYERIADFQKNIMSNAISNNAPSSVLDKISKAATIQEIADAGKGYLISNSDKLANELKTLQIKEARAKLNELNTQSPVSQKVDTTKALKALVSDLATMPGKKGAVGASFQKVIPGFLKGGSQFIAGTAAANYKATFDQLKDTLAMDNINKLKGAMSDKDLEFLRNTATKLSLGMSESEFDKELKKLDDKMNEVLIKNGVNPEDVNTFSSLSNEQLLSIPTSSVSNSSFFNK